MTKKELALEIIKRLKEEYPDAGCTLDYNQAWKLLVLSLIHIFRESLTYVEILNGKGSHVLESLQDKPIKGKIRKVRTTRGGI